MYEDDRKDYSDSYQGSGQNEYTEQNHGQESSQAAGGNSQAYAGSQAHSSDSQAYAGSQAHSSDSQAYANGQSHSGDSQFQEGGQSYSSDSQYHGSDSQSFAGSQASGANGYSAQNRMNMSHIPQERPKDRKKKSSMAAKIAGVTAAALLFGTVAGGAMFTVNSIGEYIKGQSTPEVPKVTVAQAETAGAGSSSAPVVSALQTDVSSIVEKAMPSVVAINNTMLMQQQTWFGPSQTVEVPSSGSGIIVGQNDSELLIVTNNHVVQDSTELTVTFIDNEQVAAAIKGTDSESDLAVIAVPLKDIPADTMSQIKIATMGDSDSLKVGEGVIAIGNALGYGQSVTVGYVSALNREVHAEDNTTRNLLQTDAAINPGNSGGALLNMKGEVIGINAAKYSSTEVEGMGYAIPISEAQDIINELMNKKTRTLVDEDKQGYLGIQGQNIDETASAMYGMPRGIYVFKIVEDSAASKSDLREKDIITKFDGQTVRTMEDLKEMLTYYQSGDTVNLTVQSLDNGQYQERTVQITLGQKPAEQPNN